MKRLSDSPGQRCRYRQLVDAAYTAEAERLRGDLPPKETWRREINLATTGKYSTMEMNQTTDFDKVMLELAIIAMDEYWLNRLSSSEERRLRHVIQWMIEDLEYLERQPIAWSYIQGICKQANYATSLMDCPAEHLAKVMQMVDTHVRRLAKRQEIARADLPSAYKRKGRTDAEAKALWHHDHHHHINHGATA